MYAKNLFQSLQSAADENGLPNKSDLIPGATLAHCAKILLRTFEILNCLSVEMYKPFLNISTFQKTFKLLRVCQSSNLLYL